MADTIIENKDVVIEEADVTESDFTDDELADDNTDWKAKAQELKGIAKRRATKLAKIKNTPKPQAKPSTEAEKKSSDLDYGQKAYLKASGIKSEEFTFVQEVMASTGKTLDEVIDSKYFQAELKEKRELIATKEATPSSQKRAGNSTRDSVEYWLAKGELPPEDQTELRRKVVNAKIKSQSDGNPFTKNSVVQ